MTPRTIHAGTSFAIVLVAYWTYALLAVPMIEPPAVRRPDEPVTVTGDPTPPPDEKALALLFPPGSWQLQTREILKSDQCWILYEKYKTLEDNWLELTPLTMLFFSDDPALDPTERVRRAVVLEVPEGASLRLDEPLNLSKWKIGRLIEGKLRGPVTIRGKGKLGSPQEDLLIATHDVDLSEQCIYTPNPVEFRWGPHFGRGQHMEITLLPRDGPGAPKRAGPNIGGIEQFELKHVERLHLELGSASADRKPTAAAQPFLNNSTNGPSPIEITCRGPFRFNMVQQVATFKDQVDVLRTHPSGPSDRLSCELLSIFFTQPPKPAVASGQPPKAKAGSAFNLQAQRMEAQGRPAIVSAPTNKLQAQGERLQYDLVSGAIALAGGQEVWLQQDINEIHARNLRYQPAEPGRLGQVYANGPGWLRGKMADRPVGAPQSGPQQLEARWNEKLEVRPQDKNQLISLTGGARLNFQAMGQIDAREIHFWLHELPAPPSGTPQAADKSRLQPDRMLAKGEVRADSQQLSSAVEQLEVWFTQPPAPTPPPAVGHFTAQPVSITNVPPQPAPNPAPPADAKPQAAVAKPQAAHQGHVDIAGRLLQARVLLHDQQQGELTEVTITDNVRLQETETSVPSDKPVLVTGQWLHAADANQPQANVVVKGEPAHFEGRGLDITGPNIQVDRGANVLKVDGPGQMHLPMDHDMEGRPLNKPGVMQIDWQRKMKFDGQTAHYEDQVVVGDASGQLRTRAMDVRLVRPIKFSDPKSQEPAQVERIFCDGGVNVENRSVAGDQQVSYDRMSIVGDLMIDMATGALLGHGPGRLVSVRSGTGGNSSFQMPGAGPLSDQRGIPSAPPPDPSQLNCVDLKFLGPIDGNVRQKVITFHDRVRVARAPVQSWEATLDSDDPNALGQQSVVLHSDQLTVTDMTPAGGTGRNMELLAQDNVVAEGTTFTARAWRMTYAQLKDLLILEGDGRTDAELFRQQGQGTQASRFSAHKFLYWIKLNKAEVEGMRSLETTQPAGGRGPRMGAPMPGFPRPGR